MKALVEYSEKERSAAERNIVDESNVSEPAIRLREAFQRELVEADATTLETALCESIDNALSEQKAGNAGMSPFHASNGRKPRH